MLYSNRTKEFRGKIIIKLGSWTFPTKCNSKSIEWIIITNIRRIYLCTVPRTIISTYGNDRIG